ncbi:hypothetical protein G210_4943, partial [Candida maltosa Xu316]
MYIYDEETGILTLTSTSNYRYNFIIGTGYDPELFQIVTLTAVGLATANLGSVTYTGEVPERELPAACQIPCKEQPPFPIDDTFPMTTVYTTTWTRTDEEGQATTESGIVSRLGTSESTISTFTNNPIFTSTWESIDDGGETITRSGLISTSGEEIATISTFPLNPVYTSTWEEEDDEGGTVTRSGLISQSGVDVETISTFPAPP